MSWIVTQIGARQHYAVARAFHRQSELDSMYTDIWCRYGSMLPRSITKLRSLAGRYHSELCDAKVVAFNWRTLAKRICLGRTHDNLYDDYLQIGEHFDCAVTSHLQRQYTSEGLRLFTFNTGALESLKWAKRNGIPSIVDQIDPAQVEEQIVEEECARWPQWASRQIRASRSYWDRLAAEWECASIVLVNSSWSAAALVQQGVPQSKIVIVPHAYDTPIPEVSEEPVRRDGLSILWLGQVNLRKGIQYLLQAARLIDPLIQINIVGPVAISDAAVASAPSNVRFHGAVSRADAGKWYRLSDVFVLPTLSDGFAITQLEAMSHGLPVIATPHCGEVITDELDGYIIPIRDAASLADRITRFARDRDLLEYMSTHAKAKASQFTLERYANTLSAVFDTPSGTTS